MNATEQQANACAASAPVGMFGIDDILMIGQIINLGFQIWKGCAPPTPAGEFIASQSEGDGKSYSKSFMRRSRRGVIRANRHYGNHPTPEQIDVGTTHMLNHIATAPQEIVVGCCAEPSDVPIPSDESDDSND